MDVAVVGRAQTVDHRGIGLQAHPPAQPLDEDSGNAWPLAGQSGFLLDHGGEHQRLLRRLQRQVRHAHVPGLSQGVAHAGVRELQDFHIRGAGGEPIGIGEEAPLGGLPRMPDRGHDFGIAAALQQRAHVRVHGKLHTQITEARALDHRELLENHPPLLQHLDHITGTGVGIDLVVTGLDGQPATREPQVQLRAPGALERTGALQFSQHAAHAQPGHHRDAQRLRRGSGCLELRRQPQTAGEQCAAHHQHQREEYPDGLTHGRDRRSVRPAAATANAAAGGSAGPPRHCARPGRAPARFQSAHSSGKSPRQMPEPLRRARPR
jgi:hypothetical protein